MRVRITIDIDEKGAVALAGPTAYEFRNIYDYALNEVRRMVDRECAKAEAGAKRGPELYVPADGGGIVTPQ